MNTFEWANAKSVQDAIALTVKGSVIKAGGVDLMDMMKENLFQPTRLVNIRDIKDLDYIKAGDDGLKVGPLVTLDTLSAHPEVQKRYAALAIAAGHIATPQIRNMATFGGNILQRPRCWYFRSEQFHCRKKGGEICYAQQGENQYHAIFNNALCAIVHPSGTCTALMALDAKLELTGPKAKREVLLEEFLTLPNVDLHRENSLESDELVTEVRVPALAAGATSYYIKQGEKESQDWPIAEVAVVIERDGDKCKRASVVLGAAAPVPHRATEAEAALKGKVIDENLAREAAAAAMQDATPLERNKYKIPLFKAVIARAIMGAAKGQNA